MVRVLACCLLLLPVLPCAAGEPRPFRFYKDVDSGDWQEEEIPPFPADERVFFRFYKDVDRGDSKEEEILAVILDSHAYAATRGGFPDLRVVDSNGAEAPFLVEKVTESRAHTVRETCQSRVASLEEKDDNSIEIRVRLNDGAPAAEGVSFTTPLTNYERRVSVFGTGDGREWEPLVTDGLIFDYSRYMDVSNREVDLPKNSYRQFRVVIGDITDQQESPYKELTRKFHDGQEDERIEKTTVERRPFRIDRIDLWGHVSREHLKGDKKADYPIVEFQAEEDAKEKRTIIDVRTRREPLTSFTLETASRNFSRRAVVQTHMVREETTQWIEVGRATVSRVHFRGFQREQLKIVFPEQRQENYRIIIFNEDNPPLETRGLKAEGNVYRMVFLALEGGAYRVYYGSETAEQPSYDTATVLTPLRMGYQAVEGGLGEQAANPDFNEKFDLPRRGALDRYVDRGALKEEEILAVTLDSDIYAATRGAFPDLRVVDDQDTEAPYLLEKVTESRTHIVRETCRSRVVSLRKNEDNSIDIRVRLNDEARAAEGLSLSTPLTNYERRVRISGSNDGKNWTPLVTDAVIFDYSRYMNVSNREIPLPENSYRQFNIVLDGVTDEQESPLKELTRKLRGGEEQERIEKTTLRRRPFRIDRIECWRHVSSERRKGDKKADYPVVEFQAEENAKEKRTIINVRTRREPLTGFTLQTASRNFSRPVVVQVPVKRGVRTEWGEVGQATLSVVRFRGFHRERLKIIFPEQRHQDYRIVIHNQDNPPLEITGVGAEGNVYRTVFLALSEKDYRVFYGSESEEKPNYDMATVLMPLREGYQAVEGELGVQLTNPDFGEPPGFALRSLLGNKLFLGAVICLMIIVLGWGLFRAARRIDVIPKE